MISSPYSEVFVVVCDFGGEAAEIKNNNT